MVISSICRVFFHVENTLIIENAYCSCANRQIASSEKKILKKNKTQDIKNKNMRTFCSAATHEEETPSKIESHDGIQMNWKNVHKQTKQKRIRKNIIILSSLLI